MDWTFGTTELIDSISALATLGAVFVSLFLALKAKTIKLSKKMTISEKNNLGLIVANVGDAKFTITAVGLKCNKKYYLLKCPCYSKTLTNEIREKTSYGGTLCYSTEETYNRVVLETGDIIDIPFKNFKPDNVKKIKFIIIANFKIYKIRIRKNQLIKIKNILNGCTDPISHYYTELDKKSIKKQSVFF